MLCLGLIYECPSAATASEVEEQQFRECASKEHAQCVVVLFACVCGVCVCVRAFCVCENTLSSGSLMFKETDLQAPECLCACVCAEVCLCVRTILFGG